MSALPRDWLKTAVMHRLQEQVVEQGICSKCHTKTLQSKHIGGELEWFLCSDCLTVFALPERRLVGGQRIASRPSWQTCRCNPATTRHRMRLRFTLHPRLTRYSLSNRQRVIAQPVAATLASMT